MGFAIVVIRQHHEGNEQHSQAATCKAAIISSHSRSLHHCSTSQYTGTRNTTLLSEAVTHNAALLTPERSKPSFRTEATTRHLPLSQVDDASSNSPGLTVTL